MAFSYSPLADKEVTASSVWESGIEISLFQCHLTGVRLERPEHFRAPNLLDPRAIVTAQPVSGLGRVKFTSEMKELSLFAKLLASVVFFLMKIYLTTK